MKKTKLLSGVLALALSFVYLTGCGTQNDTSGKSATAAPTSDVKKTEAPKTNELVIYTSSGFQKDLSEAFQAKTGVQVKLVNDSAGNLLAKVQAERNNPHWDILWIEGNGSMQTLDSQGMLLTSWAPQNADNYTELGKSLLPADKSYYPISTTAAAAIGYNTNLVTPEKAPKDWSDLLKPEFKDSLSMANPSIAGPAYPLVAEIVNRLGSDKGQAYFTDLKKNGMKILPTNGDGLQALVSGAEKAAILQDTQLYNAKVKNSPVELVYPTSGVAMLPAVLGIQKNAPDMENAKQFADFILSSDAQNLMLKTDAASAYFQPVINGITPKPGVQTKGMKWNSLDPAWASQHESELKKWFNENIVQ